jgi:hypothetical protein
MPITLRPLRLLDALRGCGCGIRCEPQENGHALQAVAGKVTHDPEQGTGFGVAAEDICRPCRNLRADGSSADTVMREGRTMARQADNGAQGPRFRNYRELEKKNRMAVKEFFSIMRSRLDGLKGICTHPGKKKPVGNGD